MSKKLTTEIQETNVRKYLNEHKLFPEVGSTEVDGINFIIVAIEWGDWKHDHAYCDLLMERQNYKLFDAVVTEQDGSDCYSADRIYYRPKINTTLKMAQD